MKNTEDLKLVRVPAGEGRGFSVAGANLTWKVRSDDAAGDLCLFEQVIEPGEGVPVHTHSYPESFYVLSGTIHFVSNDASGQGWDCTSGDVVVARPHTPHGFFNKGKETVRMLSISVAAHEKFFDAVEDADKQEPFAQLPPTDAFARVIAIGAQTDTHFLPPSSEASASEG
ncbi:cupin domain-containing protein [Rhizobium leguminosarum]|uniref:cupin domain-containing protein n=1 Tax=Rhizobium leguminosarum TaxID=384 RepID=UPI00143F9670|nr:cupin domain-containing protein [Rhizobium leguminosarum]